MNTKKYARRFARLFAENFRAPNHILTPPRLAVVNPVGEWTDSGANLTTAVYWAAMDAGLYNMSVEEAMEWFPTSGYAIVSMGKGD
jgi:hypothetical protein